MPFSAIECLVAQGIRKTWPKSLSACHGGGRFAFWHFTDLLSYFLCLSLKLELWLLKLVAAARLGGSVLISMVANVHEDLHQLGLQQRGFDLGSVCGRLGDGTRGFRDISGYESGNG